MITKPLITIRTDDAGREQRLKELLRPKSFATALPPRAAKKGRPDVFSKKPSIHIDSIDKVEIGGHWSPLLEELAIRLLEEQSQRGREHTVSSPPQRQPRWLALVETSSKIVSVVSGLAVVTFIVLVLTGVATIATVQVGKLLTVFSFALVGSVVSIGGVKILSINASLRRALAAAADCPFIPLFEAAGDISRRPGNPSICVKCPLGIDTSSNVEGGLIHNCRVYLSHHSDWVAAQSHRKRAHP